MSSALIRQDLVPMVVGYVLIMGALAIGLRLALRSARAEAAGAPAVTKPGQPAGQTNPAPVSAPLATPVPAAPTAPNAPAGVPPAQEESQRTARARRRARAAA